MAKSADAADLKSADPNGSWGFKSPSGHQQESYKIRGLAGPESGRETLRDKRGGFRASSKRERKVYPTETVQLIQNA